ncbi:hypothetical protein GCM10009760_01540 [Kitasatospora kazusensis]|uniref:Secreted protein n=1 Tax=Kitasatospora kazusensis TaxID=407974 RepID=A0ABN2YMW8_9ACTN
MRATWTAAVLTAALGLTTVSAVSVNVASAAEAAPATAVTRSAPVLAAVSAARPAAAIPAVPDPTKTLDVLGALGGVLKLVTGLVSSATPASGTPDPAALQKLVGDLQAAVKDLLAKLPAIPALPPLPATPPLSGTPAVPGASTVPGAPSAPSLPGVPPLLPGDTGRVVPGGLPVPGPAVPVALNPADALAKLQKDVGDLAAAATAAKPDPAAVQKLVGPLSLDTVAATTATAAGLAAG